MELLFIYWFNNIDNNKTIAYADDSVILPTGKHENMLCDRMQTPLNLIERWCKEQSISINPNKTEMQLSKKKRKKECLGTLSILNPKLSSAEEVKYLNDRQPAS